MTIENRNLAYYVAHGYNFLNSFYGIWDDTDIDYYNNHDVWFGSANDDIIRIMDRIMIIYVIIGLYLCRITSTIWWGFMIMVTVINITRLIRIMLFELVTILIVWWLLIDSNTFERGSANSYIGWFSLTLGFILISLFDLNMMTLLVMLIGLSKLPIYRLHQWLPKVHVEASMHRSMVLAGLILKIGIIFVSLYGSSIILVMIRLVSGVILMFGSDRKVIIAYSSVIHMSLCGLLIGWMRMIVGASHVVISPLMFIAVYCGYMNSGSRLLNPSFNSWVLGVILITNLGFPLIGAFMSELYLIVMLGRIILISFMLQYTVIRIVHIRLFFKMKRLAKVELKGWIILLLILY